MNITNLGVGSGLPLESLVQAYINAKAVPVESRLQKKEDSLNLELSGVGSFKSSLSNFNKILKKISSTDSFNKQVISLGDENIGVETNGFASNGSFNIEVLSLASGSKRQSSLIDFPDGTFGAGTLQFKAGTDNTFSISLDGTETLSEIRNKINSQSENFGVTANIINTSEGSFLTYNSNITGELNNLEITSTGDSNLEYLSSLSTQELGHEASSATIKIDGNLITKDTNEFKNVIEDVTITAKNLSEGDPTKMDISQDSENASALVEEFIEGFNLLMDDMTGLGAPKQGRLAFDPNLRSAKQQMINLMTEEVAGLSGSIKSLSDIGVEIDRNGHLKMSDLNFSNSGIGQERLDSALKNNMSDVTDLFSSDTGIGTKMSDLIEQYTDSDGVLSIREDSLNERIRDISDEWTNLEDSLRSYEETIRNQFIALDSTVAQYNATSDWINSVLVSSLGIKN